MIITKFRLKDKPFSGLTVWVAIDWLTETFVRAYITLNLSSSRD